MHVSRIALLLVVVVLGIGQTSSALGNGGTNKSVLYASPETDGITLSARLEGVLFSLNIAGDKYKVVRIIVTNAAGEPLLLSSESDSIEITFDDQKVIGILDLFRRDPAFWDTLEPETRKALAYPEKVLSHEEESVFIFIPKETPEKLPELFRYEINSLPHEMVLAPPKVAAS
jgi:hypothetical protein